MPGSSGSAQAARRRTRSCRNPERPGRAPQTGRRQGRQPDLIHGRRPVTIFQRRQFRPQPGIGPAMLAPAGDQHRKSERSRSGEQEWQNDAGDDCDHGGDPFCAARRGGCGQTCAIPVENITRAARFPVRSSCGPRALALISVCSIFVRVVKHKFLVCSILFHLGNFALAICGQSG